MSIYMVERELTGSMVETLTGFQKRTTKTEKGTGTSYLRSMFHPLTGRFFCLFEAPSAEAVRDANDEAGLRYTAIIPAADPSNPA